MSKPVWTILAAATLAWSSARPAHASPTWVHRIESGRAASIVPRPDGSAWFIGDTGTVESDVVVMELDARGRALRGVALDTGRADWHAASAEASDGGLLLVSRVTSGPEVGSVLLARLDGSLGLRWQVTLPAARIHAAVEAATAGFWIAGSAEEPTAGSPRALAVHLDDRGDVIASVWFPDFWWTSVRHVAALADGGCLLLAAADEGGGPFGDDAWFARLHGDGTVAWQGVLASGGREDVRGVVAGPGGGAVLAVSTNSFPGVDQLWLVELDAEGGVVSSRAYRGTARFADGTLGRSVAGGLVLADVSSTVDTDLGVHAWRLDGDGTLAWSTFHDLGLSLAFEPAHVLVLGDGSSWVAVGTEDAGTGERESRVVRLDPEGRVGLACPPTDWPLVFEDRVEGPTPAAAVAVERVFVATTSPVAVVPFRAGVTPECTGDALGPPGEVSPPTAEQPLVFLDGVTLAWEAAELSGSERFELHRGDLQRLRAGGTSDWLLPDLTEPTATDLERPGAGSAWFYLVGGVNAAGDGPLGRGSLGRDRLR